MVQVKDARNFCVPTMVRVSAMEIGMLKLFKQLVPSPNGRHENDLEINTLCPNNVRFNGKVCKTIWHAAYEWDEIEVAFSYTGREQTEQRPWRRENYMRIGPMFWIYEQEARNNILCTCGRAQGTAYPIHMKFLKMVASTALIAPNPTATMPCIAGYGSLHLDRWLCMR